MTELAFLAKVRIISKVLYKRSSSQLICVFLSVEVMARLNDIRRPILCNKRSKLAAVLPMRLQILTLEMGMLTSQLGRLFDASSLQTIALQGEMDGLEGASPANRGDSLWCRCLKTKQEVWLDVLKPTLAGYMSRQRNPRSRLLKQQQVVRASAEDPDVDDRDHAPFRKGLGAEQNC